MQTLFVSLMKYINIYITNMIRNVVIDKDTEKGKYPALKTLLTLLTNEHCRYNFIE